MEQELKEGIFKLLGRIDNRLVGIKRHLGEIQHGPVRTELRQPENAQHLEDFKKLIEEHRQLIKCQRKMLGTG